MPPCPIPYAPEGHVSRGTTVYTADLILLLYVSFVAVNPEITVS